MLVVVGGHSDGSDDDVAVVSGESYLVAVVAVAAGSRWNRKFVDFGETFRC